MTSILIQQVIRYSETLIRVSFTVILLGYFLVWLPHPTAGLSFIGIDIGEWTKFLPQVRQGDLLSSRNLFYLPPATLAAMMVLWTSRWSNRSWQTWVLRIMAFMISLLILPAIESYRDEPISQWIFRLLLIAMVAASILLAAYYSSRERVPETVPWVYFVVLGLAGALLPLWIYLSIKPFVETIIGSPVGFGAGLLLNTLGHSLLTAVGLIELTNLTPSSRSLPSRSSS